MIFDYVDVDWQAFKTITVANAFEVELLNFNDI